MTKDEMVGWHHRVNGGELERQEINGDGDESRWWWKMGKPGMLQSMGWQRGKHDLATEQQQSTKRYLTLTGTLSMQRNQSQSSPGYVPLVWMGLTWEPLGLGGSWCWGCLLCRWGMSQLPDWLYFSCKELPRPQLISYSEHPSNSKLLDEPPWWLDKLQFGERSIAYIH